MSHARLHHLVGGLAFLLGEAAVLWYCLWALPAFILELPAANSLAVARVASFAAVALAGGMALFRQPSVLAIAKAPIHAAGALLALFLILRATDSVRPPYDIPRETATGTGRPKCIEIVDEGDGALELAAVSGIPTGLELRAGE